MLMRQNTGLVVVDVQGKLARLVDESETLISNCRKLIKGAQVLGLPIIYLEQNPDKLGATVSELNDLLSDVEPVTKFTFNACDEPKFVEAVQAKDVETWLVCGIEAHICVYQTAMGLLELGYKVQVVGDCISSRTALNKKLAISRLRDAGVQITGLEMSLYELVKDCRAPEFKSILSLIR
ncbi:hydrolase [Vibrio crassostreae]|uniref:hydrolase n=1 Tax=Vibrio crassostreae TaxID=246167 RepID=UPI0010486337|nr:hydrolase [Vibrio crassostreae]TCO05139.1 nicotinamidase-related amidase [Vibrio crassostreae]CAK1835947.1 Nicotinamidase-related amidase [Vibrio crassostreae]CAK1844768.1 Nicotinamidase-related amidase [Vibrio crassostreae]CAK1869060.1 Nicotinamidase-related amidase [Vibrio crassostreae]CAK2638253.1 Nicotinamidase-related amidase [Vibrio crassostreae]